VSAPPPGESPAGAQLAKVAEKAAKKGDLACAATLWLATGAQRAEAGDTAGAREAYLRAEESGRESSVSVAVEAALERAALALDAEEMSEAVSALGWVLRSDGLAADDHARRAFVLHNLASARAFLDAHKAAVGLFRRAVEAWRACEEPTGLAESLLGLGESLVLHGEPGEGEKSLREALELLVARERRDRGLEAAGYELLARARYRSGARARAVEPLRQARARWTELASRADGARTTLGLAETLLELSSGEEADKLEDAGAWAEEGMSLLRTWISLVKKEGDKTGVAYGWWRLAQALEVRQRRREAVDSLIEAANLTTGPAHEALLARAAQLEVAAVSAAGDAARPGGLDRAVRLFEKVGDDEGGAWCRRQQLHAMVADGQFEGAAQVIRSIRASEQLSAEEDLAMSTHLAWVYASAGRNADASACARRVLQTAGDIPMAAVLRKFVAALDLGPGDLSIHGDLSEEEGSE
jgi:tetratricopeptide (TPR) repeat protein